MKTNKLEFNQKTTQMTENQEVTKKLTIVDELQYQLKIAKAIEIIEIERKYRACSFIDLTGELINLGSTCSGYTLDNLKHFKEIYTIVFDKKIVNKEWLKVFKALKVYCNIDADKYWDLKRSIEREVAE
tara:strand:- start:187 stop:573 length:387 start_codon:yes stop_codon:yes gene_type:complete